MQIHGLEADSPRPCKTVPYQLAGAGKKPGAQALKLRIHANGTLLVDPASGLDINLLALLQCNFENVAVAVDPDNPIVGVCGELVNEKAGSPPSGYWQHLLRA